MPCLGRGEQQYHKVVNLPACPLCCSTPTRVPDRLFMAKKKYNDAADPTQVVDAMVDAVVMSEPLPLR